MFDLVSFHSNRVGKFGGRLQFFEELDSTNRVASELARQKVEEGTIVLAETQTEGRGRNDHTWFSPPAGNLYFTIILYPAQERIHFLPFVCGLGAVYAMDQFGLNCDLKWPNDLLVKGKKMGGILIQTSFEQNHLQFALAGIGLNVNVRGFPEELRSIATSAASELQRDINREKMLACCLWQIEQLYGKMNSMEWEELAGLISKRSSYIRDCDVVIEQNGVFISGTTDGLDAFGGLMIRTEKGLQTFYSGEITSCRRR